MNEIIETQKKIAKYAAYKELENLSFDLLSKDPESESFGNDFCDIKFDNKSQDNLNFGCKVGFNMGYTRAMYREAKRTQDTMDSIEKGKERILGKK